MAETNQARPPDPDNGESQPATPADEVQSGAPACYDMIQSASLATGIGPAGTAEIHLLGDSELLLAATVSSEAPVNLDHALDQLTTATDLFDVPALDFHSS